jgi:leucyl-tRNA synthetase
MAPYLARELWEMVGEEGDLLKAPWPKYDLALAAQDEIEIPIQFNGKLRSRIVVPADLPLEQRDSLVLADSIIKDHLERLRALGEITIDVINKPAISNVVARVVSSGPSKPRTP